MPLRLEIKKSFSARSERVKCVDFHPREPWILCALYSGHIFIWNYQTQALVKSLEVCELPVRCAKFVPSQNWIVCGADDLQIRVYNYNTMERIKTFEAHADYIRCLAVHPTLPLLLSCSDDMFIKLWNWEKNWECQQVYEGHTHYVMQVEFNPRDPNTFASASLDRTVKVWGTSSPVPHFSLEGHERGVNCVSYYRGGDRPYLVTGADDFSVKVWDYQTKTCVATLNGHTNNVSAVLFHPQLPLILSGSEDGTIRVWHSTTYRHENTLNYGMDRVWALACLKGTNKVAAGYDEGSLMLKLGQEEPVYSMEKTGKVVYARNHEMSMVHLKTSDSKTEVADGDRLSVSTKDMGSVDLFPQSLKHSPNGRLLAICGDGEYTICFALSLKSTSFGNAVEFAWSHDSSMYVTRESSTKINVHRMLKENKQEVRSFRPKFAAEGIFGGNLLGVRGSDFIDFYDWAGFRSVRRIEVCPRKVFWSESGELVVLVCDASFYVLRYRRDLVQKFFDQSIEISEQGVDGAFDLENELQEKVRTGCFVGDCFIYTNAAGRLNYYVGGEVITLSHLPKSMYLLGYLPKENRVYVMDKQHQIYSYSLPLSVLEYQTAIVREDWAAAERAFAAVPASEHNKVARFLEGRGLKPLALQVASDPEHKFELAMQCQQLQVAYRICLDSDTEAKWKQLGDAALNVTFDLKLAEECYTKAKDYGSLLLLYSSLGRADGMEKLLAMAQESRHYNLAFLAALSLKRVDDCVRLLIESKRVPEAVFFARTYAPSLVPEVLRKWKDELKVVSLAASEALADPEQHDDLFPDWTYALEVEGILRHQYQQPLTAESYPAVKNDLYRDLVQELKDGTFRLEEEEGGEAAAAAAAAVEDTPAGPAAPLPETEAEAEAEHEQEQEEHEAIPVPTTVVEEKSPVAQLSSSSPSPSPSPAVAVVVPPVVVAAAAPISPVSASSAPASPVKPAAPTAAATAPVAFIDDDDDALLEEDFQAPRPMSTATSPQRAAAAASLSNSSAIASFDDDPDLDLDNL